MGDGGTVTGVCSLLHSGSVASELSCVLCNYILFRRRKLIRNGSKIRSFYRIVELSQGFLGPIAQNEALFYALDTLPLFVAIAVYVPFWPGRFILRESGVAPSDSPLAESDKKAERVQNG